MCPVKIINHPGKAVGKQHPITINPIFTKTLAPMNILSAQQLKEADARTLAIQQISSWQLMERAAGALFESLKADMDIYRTHFTILCGPGNNGGDGLALARLLFSAGSQVQVCLLRASSYSPDNLENQKRLGDLPVTIFDRDSHLRFLENTVIIDALYGYGLNRPLDPGWASLADQVNTSGRRVMAVDMPSGLLADAPTGPQAPVIKAQMVYTFHGPKKALLLPENAARAENFRVIDIGLDDPSSALEQYITAATVKALLRTPSRFSHKGTFGHALIAGGSYGKTGAVILAAGAALKTGCGLVTAYVPRCGYMPLQTSLPEAMVLTDPREEYLSVFPEGLTRFSALGVGIGMGTAAETEAALGKLLETAPPLVLDADALNILSCNPKLLSRLPAGTILTPHPKELERITGPWSDDFEKLEKVRELAHRLNVLVVIKGANSALVFPDGQIRYNSTGNYGMAKGGSGDVLTGMLTSLLAQGYPPHEAAITGVFLHGLAGDCAAAEIGPRGMTAMDLIRAIPQAWRQLERNG